MPFDRQKYLGPSGLCDFDRSVGIRQKAQDLVAGCQKQAAKI